MAPQLTIERSEDLLEIRQLIYSTELIWNFQSPNGT